MRTLSARIHRQLNRKCLNLLIAAVRAQDEMGEAESAISYQRRRPILTVSWRSVQRNSDGEGGLLSAGAPRTPPIWVSCAAAWKLLMLVPLDGKWMGGNARAESDDWHQCARAGTARRQGRTNVNARGLPVTRSRDDTHD